MLRIPRWLFLLLLPLSFFGGCLASTGPVWRWKERDWIHPVTDADNRHFPVLVRKQSGGFATAPLLSPSPDTVVVTSGFDEAAINNDLNALVGATGHHKFFQVLERAPDLTRVTLEVPTLHESKLQSWYGIRGTDVIPEKIMRYGPGFAFVVIPWSAAAGLAAVVVFAIIIRPRRTARDAQET